MRVYLIAAPEDQAEGEKLAEYLKRFGVFIRTEFGQMAYPPAHHGEFTLALWSRNAMMSSRQMMLTNRAIDAWEDGQLVMARLEHGLSPRGLADLDMVDLTFAAAREHRYRDVLNAIRALEDQRRAALQVEEEADDVEEAEPPMIEPGAMDMAPRANAKAASGLELDALSSGAEAAPPSPEAPSPAAAVKKKSSRPFFSVLIGAMMLIGAGVFGATLLGYDLPFTGGNQDYSPPPEPLIIERANGDLEIATPGDLPRVRREITQLETQIAQERRTLMNIPAGSEEGAQRRAAIDRLDQTLTETIDVERALSDRFEASPQTQGNEDPTRVEQERRAWNGPVLWGAIAAGFLLVIWLLRSVFSGKPKSAPVASAPTPEPKVTPTPPPTPELANTFVSYSHENAETVLPLVQSIEANGVSVWIDRDELRAGQNWAGQIVRAIKAADQFCLMCSAQAFESDHVRREVYLADKYGKTMVPIRLDETEMPEDIEYFLIGRQWVNLFATEEEERSDAILAILTGAKN